MTQTNQNKDTIIHFDREISRLEAIRLYLGLELEKCEDLILKTKEARIRQIKKMEADNGRSE